MKRIVFMFAAGVGMFGAAIALLGRAPGFEPLPPTAPALVANGATVDGRRIEPFRATYERGTRLAFLKLEPEHGIVEVERSRAADSLYVLTASIHLERDGGVMLDRIQLHGETLGPLTRTFGADTDRHYELRFETPTRLRGTITDAGGTVVRTLDLGFDAPVFEVSLLELVFGASALKQGDATRLAWDNMNNPTDGWADVRVVGREEVRAAGRTYETRVVRVRFADGSIREFAIADEPPYKIRMKQYVSGRLATTYWKLVDVEIPS